MERATRYSKKREAILAAILSTRCHPSAEWVYQRLKPDHPDLSLGTVYRNLALFQANGTIHSVGVIQGQERFDGDLSPHSHFICNCCGQVIDLPGVTPKAGQDRAVSRQYGLKVQHCELTFHGLCPDCIQQEPFDS